MNTETDELFVFETPYRLFHFLRKKYGTTEMVEEIYFQRDNKKWSIAEIFIPSYAKPLFMGVSETETKISFCVWKDKPRGTAHDTLTVFHVESGSWIGMQVHIASRFECVMKNDMFIEGVDVFSEYIVLIHTLQEFLDQKE